ncbi:hypothetical protein CARUB_v10004342mg [Capsella rubella]|uniref:Myb-like domain-containing protein n=1 Tax=Capsella rubella TaxID=81985 RepID=R0GYG8_9BRAS|nr:hypothetical protein CARUB_v10004342mg [Capsella rubella]
MTTVIKKRVRILSTGPSDADDQRNPKTHENGGKVQTLGQSKVGGSDNVVKSNTCFVCDGKDDWVLVCYGEECPIAIHQSCASDEPDFDEFGNFYCPYCWYKRVVSKCVELGEKLMVSDKSRKGCRETLGGVDLGTEDMENVVEVNVSLGRTLASGEHSGREGDGLNDKKNQKLKEVAAQTRSRVNSKAGDTDLDTGRKQRGRFDEKNHETSDAFISNTDEDHEGSSSDVGRETKPQKRCEDVNHETAQAHSSVVGVKTKEKRRYSEKNQQNKTVSGTHEQEVFVNDEGTKAHNSDLGDGRRSGKGYCHEKNQQNKVSSPERCEQKVPRTNKRVSHGSGLAEERYPEERYREERHIEKNQQKKVSSPERCEQNVPRTNERVSHCSGLGEGRYREERHIKKNQLPKTIETESLATEVFKDRKRKRERGVERDRDEFYLAENQYIQCQPDMRNDDVAFNKQENGFRNDERVKQKSVSSISSTESTNSVNESNVPCQELTLIIHPKVGVQDKPIEARPLRSIYSKKPSFQPEKYGHKSYQEKNGAVSNDPGQSDKKRKRLFWTQAEEEMLRVGVQKFLVGRNIPWRKILEFGRDVFHDGRAPSDLKDKWKMMNKMACDTGNWVRHQTERQPNYYVSEVSSD